VSTDKPKRSYRLKARAERQQATRDRIVAATVALHAARGPARTTIADIARRAQVQRLTVYNTFPDLNALFGACQGHFLASHPPPDVAPRPRTPPLERLEEALCSLYGWFRANAAMERHVYRDRHLIAELDALMKRTGDARIAALVQAHARAIGGRPAPAAALIAMLALAFSFAAWDVLAGQGLADPQIAGLMTRAAGAARRRRAARVSPRAERR